MILPKLHHAMFPITIPCTGQEIQVRQILARDEKLLLMAKTSNAEEAPVDILNAVRQVVNNCIVTPGIDPLKLALFSVEYLFLKLRAVSVTNIIKVAYQDNDEIGIFYQQVAAERERLGIGPDKQFPPEVAAKLIPPPPYEFDIDLNKVEIKFPANRDMHIAVGNNISIELKYPDSALYSNKAFLGAKPEDMLDYILQNSIKEIKDGVVVYDPTASTVDELKEFLDDLPMGTYDKLRTFLMELPHLHYELGYTNKLGVEKKITLSSLSDFFTF